MSDAPDSHGGLECRRQPGLNGGALTPATASAPCVWWKEAGQYPLGGEKGGAADA